MSEEYEQTLLIIPECYVYKIPPRSSASGYKAGDWDLTRPMWSGRLVVTSKGEICIVRLENTTNGEIFAICPVESGGVQSVEAVIDSSRYFVLRIEDGKGHHAFIGMGFTERNQAFDFSATLQDHTRHVQQTKEAKKNLQTLSQNQQDYSLKQGQTIHVNLKTKKPTNTANSPIKPVPAQGFSEGGGLLPPPPRAKPAARKPSDQQPATGWGDFVSSNTSPQYQQVQQPYVPQPQLQQFPFNQQSPQLQQPQPGFQPGFAQPPQQFPQYPTYQPQQMQQALQQPIQQPLQQPLQQQPLQQPQQPNQFRPAFQQNPQQFAQPLQQPQQFHPQP